MNICTLASSPEQEKEKKILKEIKEKEIPSVQR